VQAPKKEEQSYAGKSSQPEKDFRGQREGSHKKKIIHEKKRRLKRREGTIRQGKDQTGKVRCRTRKDFQGQSL